MSFSVEVMFHASLNFEDFQSFTSHSEILDNSRTFFSDPVWLFVTSLMAATSARPDIHQSQLRSHQTPDYFINSRHIDRSHYDPSNSYRRQIRYHPKIKGQSSIAIHSGTWCLERWQSQATSFSHTVHNHELWR